MRVATVLLISLQALVAISQELSVEEQCGALGVMHLADEELPDGVEQKDVRLCLEHPLSVSPELDDGEIQGRSENEANVLGKRACWKGKDYGCTKNWCWTKCGNKSKGEWCWLAYKGGAGDWLRCGSDDYCNLDTWKNTKPGCGKGGCKACGCSC